MLILIISIQERSIPRASYELIESDAIDEDESFNSSSSPFSPVTSVILLNDSLLETNSNWLHRTDVRFNYTRFSRKISTPRLNVSNITFTVSAHIISGPLGLMMTVYGWPYNYQINGSSGEFIEISANFTPEEFDEKLIWIGADIDGTDLSVIRDLRFTIEVTFTTEVNPVVMDLQRTNGDSLLDHQELLTLRESDSPTIRFDEFEFCFSQVNETFYLPNGVYSLIFDWEGYQHSFTDITIVNETVYLEVRIKTILINVESTQNIPGLSVEVSKGMYSFYERFLIVDEPSFYVPSMDYVFITVTGRPGSYHTPYHFSFSLERYQNRNLTLVVSENWISIGGLAFSHGRLVMLVTSTLILMIVVVTSRRELVNSSTFAPFVFLFLANILPLYTISMNAVYPIRLPLMSDYTIAYSFSIGIGTVASTMSGTVTSISHPGYYEGLFFSFMSFGLLLIVFLAFLYEYALKDSDRETIDFFVIAPILGSVVIHIFYFGEFFVSRLGSPISSVTIGPGIFFSVLSAVLWYILFRRQGKSVFETN